MMRRIGLALLLGLLLVGRADADTATQACTAASGTNWTNPTNVLANDSSSATYSNTARNQLNVTSCGFSIPTDATVNGVTVRIIGCGTGTSAARRQIAANLLGAGTCTAKTALSQNACPTMTDQNAGGAADTWSCTGLDATAVNATTFGVAIYDNDTTANELDEQYTEIVVTYTPAPTTTTIVTTTTTTTTTLEAGVSGARRSQVY